MTQDYRIFGVEASPYSVKVRSYFRYKAIPHKWIVRRMDQMAEFGRYAKLPLVPLVVTPDEKGLQDSTPIIEQMELSFPELPITPSGRVAPFVNILLEEFADEWLNKPMFHYRWAHATDQESAAQRIAEELAPEGAPHEVALSMVDAVKARMLPRLALVGSSGASGAVIEASFEGLVDLLEAHLWHRPYLFGKRPALADFGLFGQLYQLASDPTPGAILMRRAPQTMGYLARMLNPDALGDFEAWEALSPTLTPLLREQVVGFFLPWSTENARALSAGEKQMSVMLGGATFSQEPQRYHAKSLAALKAQYQRLRNPELDAYLSELGALPFLKV